MSIPDFDRADYPRTAESTPRVIEGEVLGTSGGRVPRAQPSASDFPLALLFGSAAAVVGAIGYALVGLSGFIVSIVAIGVAWLIARAMMTATGGAGGRRYQVAAVLLTYLAVSCGEIIHPLWNAHRGGLPWAAMANPVVLRYALFGPVLALTQGLNGLLGAFILAIGLRTAWQMAAGTPGFGQPGGHRISLFGIR